ncbi:hypothetical protein [Nocardia lasii]|uniref:Uncharacterized protein n=1 Tax=Nocardia lasii TaxID=1616107 RepID=A0ABW1JMD6_9NOCA
MTIVYKAPWQVTSDVAHEAAFRIDLPGPSRGSWTLSYLPSYWLLTEEQAVSGLVLAEMIVLDTDFRTAGLDLELAEIRAGELGLTVSTVMMLLAARASEYSGPTMARTVSERDGAR